MTNSCDLNHLISDHEKQIVRQRDERDELARLRESNARLLEALSQIASLDYEEAREKPIRIARAAIRAAEGETK